jgi:hypothetical protein
MALTTQQVEDYIALLPEDMSWAVKRRTTYLHFWPADAVRAAEYDARNGNGAALADYDADVAIIKASIQKPGL